MKYRPFGSTGIEISSVSFGGAAISGSGGGYGFGEIGENNSINLVHECIDKGINLFDTAPIYGYGMSEERLGAALKGKRDKVFLVSKGGIDWHDNRRVNLTNEPQVIARMLDESLSRLQTDWLDLYMIHWPDPRVDIREPLKVLKKAQENGKIKYIGLCNTNIEDLTKAEEITKIDIVQSELNWFNQPPKEVIDYISKNKLGFMGWGSFDKGILTGRFLERREFPKEDARSWAPWWKGSNTEERADFVNQFASEIENWVAFALTYPLTQDWVSTALCGVKSSEQLESLVLGNDQDFEVYRKFEQEFKKFRGNT